MREDINFPQFRRYKNGQRYYKIINNSSFEEIQIIGSKTIVNTMEAKILPDKQLIMDLLHNYHDFAESVEETEYLRIKNKTS
ncbi:MAG: hypothetical protein AB7O73_10905 [Bacteroidia bacterium]